MRRWFIAIFAVHFFVSVGLFAMGQARSALAEAHEADAPSTVAVMASDHGLTDAQPDLPDGIRPFECPAAAAEPVPCVSAYPFVRVPRPDLPGPRRPPRHA